MLGVRAQRCILVVGDDEYRLEREALCLLLFRVLPEAMVFEASPDHEKFDLMAEHASLLLFNFRPAYLRALTRLRNICLSFPSKPLVVVADAVGTRMIAKAEAISVNGVVSTSSNTEDLLVTIRDGLGGRPGLSPEMYSEAWHGDYNFSPRQAEVLELLCEGKSNKEIAALLNMSSNTVRTHVSAIFNILGVRNRTEAVVFGRRHNLCSEVIRFLSR